MRHCDSSLHGDLRLGSERQRFMHGGSFENVGIVVLGIWEGNIDMRKLPLITAAMAFAGLSTGAAAADLGGLKESAAPERARESAAPERATNTINRSNWTGPSVGAGGGGVSQVTSVTLPDPDYGGFGALGTLQVGYDYQLPGSMLVIGAFANYDLAKAEARTSETTHASYDNGWTIGGRVGIAKANSVLLYSMAGYSQGNLSNNWAHHEAFAGHPNLTHQYPGSMRFNGWTAGVGVETSLGGNWSLKTEYRYSGFSSNTYDITVPDPQHHCITHETKSTVDLSTQTARVILSYKFGGGF